MKAEYPELALPPVEVRLKEEGGINFIFDPIRKKYLQLTEEEWVRQHFVTFLMKYLKYPRSLLRTESSLIAGMRIKRSDILVYSDQLSPILLVECKGFRVKIDKTTMEQAIQYNGSLKTKCIILTNGMMHYCYIWNSSLAKYEVSGEIPDYTELVALKL